MPATSKAQQRLMGADLARARAGKPTRTGMSEKQLKEFASTPRKGLPEHKRKKKKKKSKKIRKAQEGTIVSSRDLVLAGLEEGNA